jgi:hypothetical protein
MVNLTLEAVRHISSGATVVSDRVVVAYLTMAFAYMQSLKEAIDMVLLMATPMPSSSSSSDRRIDCKIDCGAGGHPALVGASTPAIIDFLLRAEGKQPLHRTPPQNLTRDLGRPLPRRLDASPSLPVPFAPRKIVTAAWCADRHTQREGALRPEGEVGQARAIRAAAK